MKTLRLDPGRVTLGQMRTLWTGEALPALDDAAWQAVDASSDTVSRIVASGRTVYGVNTGFGLMAQSRISRDRLAELQRNLVLSHCCGVGPALDERIVRLIVALKIVGLARGLSGVRRSVVERLQTLLERQAYPVIPAQGSVGASGDLAPLAHLSAALIGMGRIRLAGEEMPAGAALDRLGLEPLELGPKEGLALLNGTQVSTALALDALFRGEHAFAAAIAAGAMSVDALKGSDVPFDPRIHEARGHRGQADVAAAFRTLLSGSPIRASHVDCDRVQDPYSLRCQPQVMGAALDVMRMAAATLVTEANAATDNPLVFVETGEALSGGNFHAEPVAFAADMLTNALAEIGSLSERRLSLLVDPKMSGGLPAFLVKEGGLNSGFMIAQVTAAALVSENKARAHPSSVDSIPTSANQEDHVSMATYGARRAGEVAANVGQTVAIELLAAAQGLDLLAPLQTSPRLIEIHGRVRATVAHYERDRYFADDLAAAAGLVEADAFAEAAGDMLPSRSD